MLILNWVQNSYRMGESSAKRLVLMSDCRAVASTREYSTKLSYDLVAVNQIGQQELTWLPRSNAYKRLFGWKNTAASLQLQKLHPWAMGALCLFNIAYISLIWAHWHMWKSRTGMYNQAQLLWSPTDHDHRPHKGNYEVILSNRPTVYQVILPNQQHSKYKKTQKKWFLSDINICLWCILARIGKYQSWTRRCMI